VDDRPVILDGPAAFRFALRERQAHHATGELEYQQNHAFELLVLARFDQGGDMIAEHLGLMAGFGDVEILKRLVGLDGVLQVLDGRIAGNTAEVVVKQPVGRSDNVLGFADVGDDCCLS